jgi:hypothetical protein
MTKLWMFVVFTETLVLIDLTAGRQIPEDSK